MDIAHASIITAFAAFAGGFLARHTLFGYAVPKNPQERTVISHDDYPPSGRPYTVSFAIRYR